MKKYITILFTLLCIVFTNKKIHAQILAAGDAVVTFGDAVYTYPGLTPPSNLVMEVLRTSNTAAAAPNLGTVANPALTWATFMYYDARWTTTNLGKIFGVTIDNNKNIFVSATGFVGPQPAGKSTGGVYKIDGITGTPSLVKDLNPGGPNTDLGLGNIKYFNGYLYISNLKDGKLYCIQATTPYTTMATYTPTGWSANDKPCGLGIRNVGGSPRLYFSRNGFNAATTSIYSINILPGGLFGVLQNTEITAAAMPTFNNANPITDIAFSKTGSQILLAQKTNPYGGWNIPQANIGGSAHASTVHKYNYIGASWVNAVPNFNIGYGVSLNNSAGGVDFSDFQINKNGITFCDTSIYVTADAITFGNSTAPVLNYYCYGMSGFNNQTGAGSSTGINIDFNNASEAIAKGHYGDVEILDTLIECANPVPCPCVATPRPYLTWVTSSTAGTAGTNNQLDLSCGETYTDKLICYQPYIINMASPCGPNCPADSVITTIQYPSGATAISYSTTGVPLLANQVGTYTITIKVKCAGVWCKECKLTFIQTKKCEPPCDNCKDKVQATFNPALSNVNVQTNPTASTLNAAITLNGGADIYTQIRVNVVDVQVTSDNPACLQCYNIPNQWGSLTNGVLAGFAATFTSYNNIAATNANNNVREIVFNAASATAIPAGTNLNLSIQIPGVNPISCCCIKVVVYVKITYRNNKCEECSKIVKIAVNECAPKNGDTDGKGTYSFDKAAQPQPMIMHKP